MTAGFIIRGDGIDLEGFGAGNLLGHGMELTSDPGTNNSVAGIYTHNMALENPAAAWAFPW